MELRWDLYRRLLTVGWLCTYECSSSWKRAIEAYIRRIQLEGLKEPAKNVVQDKWPGVWMKPIRWKNKWESDRCTGVELFHRRRISKNNLLCALNVLVQRDCSRVIVLCYLEVGQPAYSYWWGWNCTVRHSTTNADCCLSGMAPKFFVNLYFFSFGGRGGSVGGVANVLIMPWRNSWQLRASFLYFRNEDFLTYEL